MFARTRATAAAARRLRPAWSRPAVRAQPTRALSQTVAAAAAYEPNANFMQVFNRGVKRIQRDRAAVDVETSREVDYLRDEIADRLVDRLLLISRQHDVLLDFGSGAGALERAMMSDREDPTAKEDLQRRTGRVVMAEMSEKLLYRDADPDQFPFNRELDITRVRVDEENLLTADVLRAVTGDPGVVGDERPADALFENTVNAVVSNLSMHWVNDLPGVLRKIKHMLVPDGIFMAAMLGGDSLYELRTSLQLAEMERDGRIAPRLSPLADVKDMGGLLQQAGYNLITVDVDDVIVSYPDMFALMRDLQAMGESNSVFVRPHVIPRDVLLAAQAIYSAMHGNEDGTLPATFRIIYLAGWKPAPTQPKPLERGSADVSLKDVL
ncbi:S-adenosyl-L-methionine-dependent methyltransferase [Dipodascopsis tothii]|uniref:S-adenosyl-L-methionine-dependent methyltransferase n=1 Tax=Dipodascopsis tothii TaxID=44089 RepID=UPI0034CDDC7C